MVPLGYFLLAFLLGSYKALALDDRITQLSHNSNINSRRSVNFSVGSMCPPWYLLGDDGRCHQGNTLTNVVEFQEGTGRTLLQVLYCMTTHGNTTNRTDVIGGCFFSIRHYTTFQSLNYMLPSNISKLNELMCADYNREGQLCGRCMKGFAPPVYSYSLVCVNCTDYHLNWLKYIGVAFGPLTLFCLLICFFHISATSPYLHSYVFFCQIFTSHNILRMIVNGKLFNLSFNSARTILVSKIYLTLVNFWNLDIFVLFYEPRCLHPKMSIVQALTLNYLIAFYPLALLLVVYCFVKLHSRNVAVIVALWKPFRVLHRPFLRNLNVQTSLIESFATLYFLSAMKIQSVTVDLLAPTPLYFANGTVSSNMYLYLAGDVEYFGSEHALYGIMALFFFITFTLVPGLLLFLYPYRFFQQFLNKIRCNFVTLKIFMDVFQGNYKDGTNNNRDYRLFSGFFFFGRFMAVIIFFVFNSQYFIIVSGVCLTIFGFSIAVTHPQRTYVHYFLDCFILTILSLILFIAIGLDQKPTNYIPETVGRFFANAAAVLPLLYSFGLVGYWVIIKKKIPQTFAHFVKRTVINLFTLSFVQHNSESGYQSLQTCSRM